MIKVGKRIRGNILVVFTFLITMLFVGCNNNESTGKYTSKEIYDNVLSAMSETCEMIVVDNTTDEGKTALSYVTNVDEITDFVFAYSKEGKADEIIVMQVKDSNKVGEAKKDLEERLDARKSTFSVYDAKEGGKFNGASVVVKGNYLMLIIGNEAQNGKYEFNKLFED